MKSIIDGMLNQQFKPRVKKKDFVKLKNKIDLMYCPKCKKMSQYRLRTEGKERACPFCGHFFIPANCNRMKHISAFEWDSPSQWEEI